MSGERSGTTTAPNRSTDIRTKLWTDTKEDASARKAGSLHKIWPRRPPISHESTCKSNSRLEIENIGNNKSDRAMLRSKNLSAFLSLVFCKQWLRRESFQPTKQRRSNWRQWFFQVLLQPNLDWSSSTSLIHLLLCSCLPHQSLYRSVLERLKCSSAAAYFP